MQPLDGVRVLDLTRGGPGPFCGMVLGDLGADVIRVEDPQARIARMQPAVAEGSRRQSSGMEILARNKRVIAIDMRRPEGQDLIYKLARTTDVVMEGFRPDVAQRLKVDYETLQRINERIIYISISGFGQEGPLKNHPGHDLNYISIAGFLDATGKPGHPPPVIPAMVADFGGAGNAAAVSILAGLLARERYGVGQYIDLSMTDSVLYTAAWLAGAYLSTGTPVKRGEHTLNGGAPFYNVYETSDGKYITLGCMEPHFWENLCRSLGMEDLVPHQNAQGEEKERIFQRFRQAFRTKTRDQWFEELSRNDVCVAKVNTMAEALAEPQLAQRMLVQVDDPQRGKITHLGTPFKLSKTPGSVRHLGSSSWEETERVLKEAGVASKAIRALKEQKVIA